MRRTRLSRSRLRSGIRRSTFPSSRTNYASGRTVILKGPMAFVFIVGIVLFFLSFAFNIFLIAIGGIFEPIFFFIPFGIILTMVLTMVIASFVTMFRSAKNQTVNPRSILNQNQSSELFNPHLNLLQLAQKAGLKVTMLPHKDPSTAQGYIENDQLTILVKILSRTDKYDNVMLQNLSKGLVRYQAKEAWLIQQTPTFVESDLNIARFYNVRLLDKAQAFASLQTLLPSSKEGLSP